MSILQDISNLIIELCTGVSSQEINNENDNTGGSILDEFSSPTIFDRPIQTSRSKRKKQKKRKKEKEEKMVHAIRNASH